MLLANQTGKFLDQISLEQNDEKAWFLACWYKFIKIKSWLKKVDWKVLYKMIVSLSVCVARQAQSAKNNKFAISLQHLKENLKDKVDFLPVDKCRRFLQSDSIILGVCGLACPNYPK